MIHLVKGLRVVLGAKSCHKKVTQLFTKKDDNDSVNTDSLSAVGLPAEVDFDQLGEARDAPIREATAARARALVHIARAARQTLDDLPNM